MLDIVNVVDDKDVLSLSSGGRVREYALVQARVVPAAATRRAATGFRPARS